MNTPQMPMDTQCYMNGANSPYVQNRVKIKTRKFSTCRKHCLADANEYRKIINMDSHFLNSRLEISKSLENNQNKMARLKVILLSIPFLILFQRVLNAFISILMRVLYPNPEMEIEFVHQLN